MAAKRGIRTDRAREDAGGVRAGPVALASRAMSDFAIGRSAATMLLLRIVVVVRCITSCAASPGPSDAAWWKTGQSGKSCDDVCGAISASADITRLAAMSSEAEGLFADAVVSADVARWWDATAAYAGNLSGAALNCTIWSGVARTASSAKNNFLPAKESTSCKWNSASRSASRQYYDPGESRTRTLQNKTVLVDVQEHVPEHKNMFRNTVLNVENTRKVKEVFFLY